MSKKTQLYVQFKNILVGIIYYHTKEEQFDFVYDELWIKNKYFQISPHITYKLSEKGVIKRYLENLLPEGHGLTHFARLMKVDKSNVFSLTNSIGKDLSGALQITINKNQQETSYREISNEELTERIKKRKQESIVIWDNKPRLSVAGVQDKLTVTLKENEYGFGEGSLCSTHILKFSREIDDDIVLNEYFCMKLAKLSGLNVADGRVVNLGERVLEVKRFDRQMVSDTLVEKLHIIDGCQALDIAPIDKYERFLGDEDSVKDILGPASLSNLYNFSDQCRLPAKTKLGILQWVIFNLIIGNSDNHLKNISFFVSNDGIELAPFYDLLSVTIYPKINHSMAFCIGEEFDPTLVDKNAILLMAHELGLKLSFVNRQANLVIKNISKVLDSLNLDELELSEKEKKFVNSLRKHIFENIRRYSLIFKN